MIMTKCTDKVILNLWHPLAATAEMPCGKVVETVLLEERLSFAVDAAGAAAAWRSQADLSAGTPLDLNAVDEQLPVKLAYGYIWTSLGSPPADIFPIPEYEEA